MMEKFRLFIFLLVICLPINAFPGQANISNQKIPPQPSSQDQEQVAKSGLTEAVINNFRYDTSSIKTFAIVKKYKINKKLKEAVKYQTKIYCWVMPVEGTVKIVFNSSEKVKNYSVKILVRFFNDATGHGDYDVTSVRIQEI